MSDLTPVDPWGVPCVPPPCPEPKMVRVHFFLAHGPDGIRWAQRANRHLALVARTRKEGPRRNKHGRTGVRR